MHHRHHGRSRGPRMLFRDGFPSRHELLERLESHQRDRYEGAPQQTA